MAKSDKITNNEEKGKEEDKHGDKNQKKNGLLVRTVGKR